jgi:hypothetical protein
MIGLACGKGEINVLYVGGGQTMKDGCMRALNLSTILHAMKPSRVRTTRHKVSLTWCGENLTQCSRGLN